MDIGLYPISMVMLAYGDEMPSSIKATGGTSASVLDEASSTLVERLCRPRVDLSAGVTLRYGNDKIAVVSYDLQVQHSPTPAPIPRPAPPSCIGE